MLKHGRAGVPMEVMGLMLGEFVDDYTVRVIDVFAMPQSGTVCLGFFFLGYQFYTLALFKDRKNTPKSSVSCRFIIVVVVFYLIGGECGSSGPCVSGQNVGHAKADWQVRCEHMITFQL